VGVFMICRKLSTARKEAEFAIHVYKELLLRMNANPKPYYYYYYTFFYYLAITLNPKP
jgi:hypothetical protein